MRDRIEDILEDKQIEHPKKPVKKVKKSTIDSKILDALRSNKHTQIQSRFEFANKKQLNKKQQKDQNEDFSQLS